MKKKPIIPTIRIEAKAKKPAKAKVKAKKQPKPRTVGAPPLDATPPEIKDTRPKAKPIPVATPEPAKPVTEAPKAIPAQPKQVPAKNVPLTGRMVQGLNCTWLGDMAEAGGDPNGQPLCPYCNSPLLTAMDMATIVLGVKAYELGAYDSVNPPPRPHPGYVAFFDWMHKSGKCYPSIVAAAAEYEAQTGNKVDPTR